MNSNWNIREANGDDIPFIYSTWAKSYKDDSSIGRSCRNSIFFRSFIYVIDMILKRDGISVAVACNPEAPYIIYGYMVAEPNILYYSFTKLAFLRFGIAKSLYEYLGSPKFYAFKTVSVIPILDKHPQLDFNPFVLFKQSQSSKEGQNGQTE